MVLEMHFNWCFCQASAFFFSFLFCNRTNNERMRRIDCKKMYVLICSRFFKHIPPCITVLKLTDFFSLFGTNNFLFFYSNFLQ